MKELIIDALFKDGFAENSRALEEIEIAAGEVVCFCFNDARVNDFAQSKSKRAEVNFSHEMLEAKHNHALGPVTAFCLLQPLGETTRVDLLDKLVCDGTFEVCWKEKSGDSFIAHALTRMKLERAQRLRHQMRQVRLLVVTMSERAARGIYEDKSGPRAREILESYFAERSWQCVSESAVIADQADELRFLLSKISELDVVVITGGTGVGPQDVTIETVRPLLQKEIPGIMEQIRLKYAEENPHALLSRSVAGVNGTCLIYAVPGSVRAVEQYMTELVKTIEHLLFMVRGLGH